MKIKLPFRVPWKVYFPLALMICVIVGALLPERLIHRILDKIKV